MLFHCPNCHDDKPKEAFGKAKWRKEGISYRCKSCNARSVREWARKHPEKIKVLNDAAYRKWREKNPILKREPFITSEGRLCRTCGIRKQTEDFVFDKRGIDGRGWRCRECAKIAVTRWQNDNPLYRLVLEHKISAKEILDLMEKQAGRCAICRRIININGNRRHSDGAHIDHDHKTGAVRGLLCPPCNMALGGFNDNIDSLRRAIRYLTGNDNNSWHWPAPSR